MSRRSKPLECSSEELAELQSICRTGKNEHRLVERCQIVLACSKPHRIDEVAKALGVSQSTVKKWRERFRKDGMAGLSDAPRSGRPIVYGKDVENAILAKIGETPPDGMARWDGPTLARELHLTKGEVWRVCHKNNIQLARLRTWCVSKDPEFT